MKPVKNINIPKMSDDELGAFLDKMEEDWYAYYDDANELGDRMRKFLYEGGGQWDSKTKEDNQRRFKRTFENNSVRSIQTQLESEMRDSAPEALLIAAHENIPTEIIETKVGLYREDCYQSNTPYVYTQAFTNQMDLGYGAIRLVAKQENPRSFNCVLRYKPVRDATVCWFDPSADDICKQDGDGCGFSEDVSLSKLERIYPDKDFTKDLSENGKCVKVRHAYVKCYQALTWCRLINGHEMTLSEYNKRKKKLEKINKDREKQYKKEVKRMREDGVQEEFIPKFVPVEMPEIVKRLKSLDNYKLMHVIRTSSYILDRSYLPITRFPLHFVPGNVKWSSGKEKPLPFCVDAMTPQQLLNTTISQIMDSVDRAIGSRWVAPDPAVRSRIGQWARQGENMILTYDAIMTGSGQANWEMARPTLETAPAVDQTLLMVYQQCQADIRMTLGRSAESTGEESNTETYGGIMLRRMASDAASGVITLNLMAAIAETAKTYLEWMPFVYDNERNIKIRGEDGTHKYKTINEITGEMDMYQEYLVKNDMRQGEFTIEAHGGPSFAMQRLAGIHLLMQLMAQDPELKSISYDLLFKELPFAYGTELGRRAKETGLVNPIIVAQEKGEEPQPPQPTEEQKIEQAKVHIEALKQLVALRGVEQKDREYIIKGLQSVLDLQSDTVTALATEAKAFGMAPLPQINQTMQQTEGMLTNQGAFLQTQEKNLEFDNQPKE